MKHLRIVAPLRPLSGLASVLLAAGVVLGQPASIPDAHFWRPDGPVRAAVEANGTLYFGGAFSYVGPASGAAAIWDPGTRISHPVAPLSGAVYRAIPDGNGGWFVGGAFTTGGNNPKNLAHILPDGSLDLTFQPDPDGGVYALFLSGNQLFIGGDFQKVHGLSNPYLTILNAANGRTNGFRLQANNTVRAFAADGETLYIGGAFSLLRTYSGNTTVNHARRRVGAVNVTTFQPTAWSSDPSFGLTGGSVGAQSLAVFGGTVYVGGDFTAAAGKPRRSLAALNSTTGDSSTWNPNPQDTGNSPFVSALLAEAGGLVVGGNFTSIGSRTRRNLAHIAYAGVGQASDTFAADTDGPVYLLDRSVDGRLVVGGRFSTIKGVSRRGVARLAVADQQVATDDPIFSQFDATTTPTALGVFAYVRTGNLEFFGGDFLSFAGAARNNLAAVSLTSGSATAWNPGANGAISGLALDPQAAEKVIYIVGSFTNLAGAARRNGGSVRIADGQATSFDPNIPTGTVTSVAVSGDRVYIGGQFTQAAGKPRSNVAGYLLPAGTVTDWAPNPAGRVETLTVTADRVYLGGSFTSVLSDGTRANLAAVTPVHPAKLVAGFTPRPNGLVRRMNLSGGQLYVGGDFTQIATQPRSRVAVLNPDTGAESTLLDAAIPNTGQQKVYNVLPAGETVYVAGAFTSVGGENRARAAAVIPSLGTATGWNPGPDNLTSVLLLAGNKLILAGEFTRLGLKGANPNPNGAGTFPFTYLAFFDTSPAITEFKINAAGNPEVSYRDGLGLGQSGVEVQYQDNLGGLWESLALEDLTGAHQPVVDTAGKNRPQRFYRVIVP